ncbi:HAD family hydrolase [Polaribacter butkevichii]|uniref:phosphoglycolate phosphatase n=1 Tax=Polaribacter butkevichii TaxID=218490 RepID=A0A2P6C6X3_9FLAO|nr:HAD family hydrolase [Polaribacter butkevichii]PQJ68681.1 HAD family hydrolase [Polaribacter butkevichii]
MKYKAVIFDLDGTLVNSIKDIADAMNVVLEKRQYPTYNYETYKTFVGSGVRSLVVKALPDANPKDKEVEACLNDMMQVYSEVCTAKTKPYEGILELLEELNAKNIKVSVLSNKEDTLTKKIAAFLLPEFLSPVLGLKVEVDKKPNPKVALETCDAMQVKPEETIFVGDTDVDILVAKNANMLPVGVSWGFRDKESLINAGSKHVLEHPSDLIKIVTS